MQNLALPDYHDFFNAISPNPASVPSHASFEVVWAGGGARQKVRDATFDFGGDYVTGPATISFSVWNDNSATRYRSDAAGQTTAGPPGVGHERNGVFFQ